MTQKVTQIDQLNEEPEMENTWVNIKQSNSICFHLSFNVFKRHKVV